jgi:hypothetical protein
MRRMTPPTCPVAPTMPILMAPKYGLNCEPRNHVVQDMGLLSHI